MAAVGWFYPFVTKFTTIYARSHSKIAFRTVSTLALKSSYHAGNAYSVSSRLQNASICNQSVHPSSRLFLSLKFFSTVSTRRCLNDSELLNRKTPLWCISRSVTIISKLGKRKTCKAVAKRFHRTGKGKLKRWRAGKNHNMLNKSNKRRKQLKKPTYVSKQQLKLLNKMLNGW